MTENRLIDSDKPVVEVVRGIQTAEEKKAENIVAPVSGSSATVPPVASVDRTPTIVTILLLFFAYPIGIIVMWLWPKWSKIVKVLVSLPFVLSVIAFVLMIRMAATNPDVQRGLGFVGTIAECGTYSDKAQQQQCLGAKAADFTRQQICQKEGQTSAACAQITSSSQRYMSCLKSKSLQECESIMKQVGDTVVPTYTPGQEEELNKGGDPDMQQLEIKQ